MRQLNIGKGGGERREKEILHRYMHTTIWLWYNNYAKCIAIHKH